MTVYVVLAAILAVSTLIELIGVFRFPKSIVIRIISETVLIASILAMTFVSGYRLNTGYDYPSTVRIFMRSLGSSISDLSTDRLEKGFILLNVLAGYISSHANIISVCVAALISAILYIGLKGMTKYPATGLLAFYLFGYYFNSMNFLRNFLAAIIVFNAFAFLRGSGQKSIAQLDSNDKHGLKFTDGMTAGERMQSFTRYTALVLAATAFHRSAIIMLLFWFILRIKINLASLPVYLAVSGVIIYYVTPAMKYITTYIYPAYAPDTSPSMYNGIPVIYSLCIGAVFVVAFLWRKRFYGSAWNTVLISAAYFAFFFEFIGSRHSILGRFTMYFGIATAGLLIPELVIIFIKHITEPIGVNSIIPVNQTNQPELISDKLIKRKIMVNKLAASASLVCITAAGITFFAYALTHNYNGVVPHDWIWNLYVR
jgi:hypothetical protein